VIVIVVVSESVVVKAGRFLLWDLRRDDFFGGNVVRFGGRKTQWKKRPDKACAQSESADFGEQKAG